VCRPGAYVAVFNSTRTAAHVQVALEDVGFYARDTLAYRKPSGIPKGFNLSSKLRQRGRTDADQWVGWHSALRNEWEAIVLVQKPLVNNYLETFDLYGTGVMKAVNEDGAFQSNVLEGLSSDGTEAYNIHATVKPLPLMRKLVELLVPPGQEHAVLDPFAGSGTTLVAAALGGRSYVGIEIVPEYVAIIERRLGELPATGEVGPPPAPF
jgi:site-specific DNA-methyltransferase (adenine-specific)